MDPVTSFDSLVLAAVVAELRQALAGARVARITQPSPDEVALIVRARAGERAVLCSIHPRWARVYLTSAVDPAGEPGDFVRMLRGRLQDARVEAVEQVPWERIVILRCAAAVGPALLVAELMGRHSTLVLVEDGVVRGCLPPRRSAVREVVPGRPYQPPPAAARPPEQWTAQALQDAVGFTHPLAVRLREVVLGLGPATSREICARAGVSPDRPAGSPDELRRVWEALREVADCVAAGRFAPTLYRHDGEPVGYAPFPYVSLAALAAEPATMSAAVDAVLGGRARQARVEEARARVCRLVRTALERVDRATARVAAALDEAEGASRLREQGQLLLAYAGQVPAGAAEAVLPDFSGVPVRIPLDPALTPVDNARRLFARYARMRDAAPQLRRRREALQMERAYLEESLLLAEQAATDDEISDLRRELAEQGYGPPPRRPPPVRRRAGPRRYVLAGGAVALVGRTGRENDRLTFAVARASDLWFHARQVPGAHVILQAAGPPSEEAIRQAAALAAYYSRARGAGEVAVDYTERRHVRKPPGAPPGMVSYSHARTVYVRPAPPP